MNRKSFLTNISWWVWTDVLFRINWLSRLSTVRWHFHAFFTNSFQRPWLQNRNKQLLPCFQLPILPSSSLKVWTQQLAFFHLDFLVVQLDTARLTHFDFSVHGNFRFGSRFDFIIHCHSLSLLSIIKNRLLAYSQSGEGITTIFGGGDVRSIWKLNRISFRSRMMGSVGAASFGNSAGVHEFRGELVLHVLLAHITIKYIYWKDMNQSVQSYEVT